MLKLWYSASSLFVKVVCIIVKKHTDPIASGIPAIANMPNAYENSVMPTSAVNHANLQSYTQR